MQPPTTSEIERAERRFNDKQAKVRCGLTLLSDGTLEHIRQEFGIPPQDDKTALVDILVRITR